MKYLTGLMCCLLFVATASQASEDFCANKSSKIIKQLYPNYSPDENRNPKLNDELNRSLASIECKVWPANPKLAILALKADHPSTFEESREAETSDLIVLMVSTETNTILSVHTEDDALFSDAIYVTGIEIDTAYYKLANDTVAFGIKEYRSGSSSVYPFHNTSMSLYTYKRGRINKVLDNMQVQKFAGEWDTHCEGKSGEDKRIIIIQKQSNQGYANLLVKTTTTKWQTLLTGDECSDVVTNTDKQQITLKYDGHAYPVPKAMQGL
ncbi:hypothetical protein [Vibrio intestinalis]|uniref:hypothetical protein n=1 Tax=Vibrio intestinalis TaxID=2933291 RepID=UPI0021A4C2CE|nr:hypothetical protein [Vibrio intestinalis]